MPATLVALAALSGAAAGAFLPRPAHRLAVPAGAPPRVRCGRCGTPFAAGTAGWLRAGRACPAGCPALPGPWVTGPATAAAAAAVAAAPGLRPLVPALLAAAVLGVLLAAVDVGCLRLPDPLVAALGALVVPAVAAAALAGGEPARLGRAAAAAALGFAVHLALALLPGGGVGLGDVKLAGVLGLVLGWAGWPAVAVGMLVPPVLGGVTALALVAAGRAGRRTPLPYGPALLAGAALALAVT